MSRVNNQNWSTLFWHKDALYILGCGFPENGFVVRKSTDKGLTWTEPKDDQSGLIFKERMLTNVMPIAVANGRLYVSAEQGYGKPKGWCHQYSLVVSSPAESNLLDVANWTQSSRVLIPPEMANLAHVGWLEGNMVLRKADGKVFNILRVHGITDEIAAFYEISADGKTARLNTHDMFLRMPGAAKKFYIFPDNRSDTYYVLSNWILEKDRGKVGNCPHQIKGERTRNTLALARSNNLMDWEVVSVILHDDDVDHCGFQYPSAVIEGDDLLVLSRTAFSEDDERADNQHNSNFITFHRVRDFRGRTLKTRPLTEPSRS